MTGDDSTPQSDRAAVEALDEVLADRAVWVQPPAGLQEQIVAAIAAEKQSSVRRSRSILATIITGAAALVLVIGVVVGLGAIQNDKPVQYSAALRGTGLAPEASGQVTLTRTESGWQIDLHATGLPRRDGGEYYEAWLKNEDGVLVPVGTFNEAQNVVLWSGVSPESHRTFTVTRQLADGNPASSGQVVLKGSAKRS